MRRRRSALTSIMIGEEFWGIAATIMIIIILIIITSNHHSRDGSVIIIIITIIMISIRQEGAFSRIRVVEDSR